MTEAASLAAILDREWSMLVGGHLTPARSGRRFSDESPVTEEIIAAVPDGDATDVGAAVEAALPAAAAGRRGAPRGRGSPGGGLGRVLEDNAAELALLDAIDGGHPVTGMHLDVAIAADTLRLFAGLGIGSKGSPIPG